MNNTASKNQADFKSDYMLLGRLKEDCLYYLGFGGRSPRVLWAKDEVKQIAEMERLYKIVPVKPVWITLKELKDFKLQMTGVEDHG